MKPGPKIGWRGDEQHRFWLKIELLENGCWQWTGAINSGGYGQFGLAGGKSWKHAHQWAYEKYIGPVPDGKELDHTCRNRWCASPFHVEPVTHRINLLRGDGISAINSKKTHCLNGHPLSPENIELVMGQRRCLKCKAVRSHNSYLKRKARGYYL